MLELMLSAGNVGVGWAQKVRKGVCGHGIWKRSAVRASSVKYLQEDLGSRNHGRGPVCGAVEVWGMRES